MLNLALALLADPQVGKPVMELPQLVLDTQAVSPDHKRIAVATQAEGVWVIDMATRSLAFRVAPTDSVVEYVTWSSDSARLGLLHRNADIEVVDAAKGTVSATTSSSTEHRDRVWRRELLFAANDNVIIVALGGPPTDIFSAHDAKLVARLNTDLPHTATAMALSRDGATLAIGNDAATISLWSARDGQPRPETTTVALGRTFKRIHSLDFSPSGDVLAIGSGDCRVRLWNRAAGPPLREFSFCDIDTFDNQAIGSARFSKDGTRLVATTFKYWDIRVWDLSTNELVQRVDFGGGQGRGIAAWFTTDGSPIVTDLGCRFAPSVAPTRVEGGRLFDPHYRIPGGWPAAEEYAFYQCDGDYAWAVVDHHLVVRKIPDEEPVLRIPVRER